MRSLLLFVLICFAILSCSDYGKSSVINESKEELHYKYDNNKKWEYDNENSYYGEPSYTTGIVNDCRHKRSLSCTIPDDGEISFSWMKNSAYTEYLDYLNFSFCINNVSIDKCNYINWSPRNSYVVNRGDNIKWIFSLDSPPCQFNGIGWIIFKFNNSSATHPPIPPIKGSCEIKLDVSPDGESDLTKIAADLIINASKSGLCAANISLNFSDDFNLIKCKPEGFLFGASCTIKGRTLECNLLNLANNCSSGYLSIVVQLIGPKPGSKIFVCLNNLSIKDINGDNLKINGTSPCDFYYYGR